MEKRMKRLVLSDRHRFKHSCEEVFGLACPVREDNWIPGWRNQREIIYTESGLAELSCTFKTKSLPHHLGQPATWVNNVYEPFRKIQYSAMNEEVVYQIQLDLTSVEGGCEVVITRTWTALTAVAEEFLEKLQTDLARKPPDLFRLMDHYLTTGKMME